MRVQSRLVFRGVADETLSVGKCDVRGRRSVTLIVCDNLYTIILPDTDARVGRAEIDTDSLDHCENV